MGSSAREGRKRVTSCYANISPQTQKRKKGKIWTSELSLFAFYFGPYCLLPAIYLLQSLNALGKLPISGIYLTVLYFGCFFPTQMISSRPEKYATTWLHPHQPNTFHPPHASNSFNKTKPYVPQLEIRHTTLGDGACWLKYTGRLLRDPLRKIPSMGPEDPLTPHCKKPFLLGEADGINRLWL